MNEKKLIEKLEKIAEMEGIPKSDLILDEARYFSRVHKKHGGPTIELGYRDGQLDTIDLTCPASKLVITEDCPHQNPETVSELAYSIVYSRQNVIEIDEQKERREEEGFR